MLLAKLPAESRSLADREFDVEEGGGLVTEVPSSFLAFLALQSNTEQLSDRRLILCIIKCFARFDVLPSFASTTFWQIEHLALLVST
jgi:hypothetical protein